MRLKILIHLFLISSSFYYGQYITTDINQTPEQLRTVLTQGSCLQFNTVNLSSPNSVGYFNRNGSSFPFDEGVVLRTGDITQSPGPYTNTNLSTLTGLNITDPYLQNLSNQTSGQNDPLRDIAFFDFDFTAISNFISFNFIFASNEYGQFQCLSNDIFAVVLTNLNTGVSINLGVIPGTNQPISVRSIRDQAFNPSCASTNQQLFGNYNVNNPLNSPINFRGNTIPLRASSVIQPNVPYNIRFIIADFSDNNFDSALFVEGNSFQSSINLGQDTTICSGDSINLNSGLDNSFTFNWFLNNVLIVGANNASLTVTQPGEYRLEATRDGCTISDTIVINELTFNTPPNLSACDEGSGNGIFNLATNNQTVLGLDSSIYQLLYYANLNDFNSNTPIPIVNLNNFLSSGQTIYIGIVNINTGLRCTNPITFNLIIRAPFQAGQNVSASICETGNNITFNLNTLRPQLINGNPGSFGFRYFTSELNAINNVNFISPNINLPPGPNTYTYWVRMFYTGLMNCFSVVPVTIIVNPAPLVDTLPLVVVCSEFVFPTLTNGSFYSLPNGAGINYLPGDTTVLTGLYYIFNGPNEFGCTNQSSFQVYVIETYDPPISGCGSYTVPSVPENFGFFYTAPGGPNGGGVLVPAGTVYENNGTDNITFNLYFYAELDGVVCRDDLFVITVSPLIESNNQIVNTCEPYQLLPLSSGQYFTQPNGQGTELFAGTIINTTSTIYIYDANSFCNINSILQINFLSEGQVFDVTNCGPYTLPSISSGNFYALPNANGPILDPNVPITSSQTVYHYTISDFGALCFTENVYNITITPLPPVDQITNTISCGLFVLPTLTHGNYYLLPGGPNVPGQELLQANMVIDLSGNNLISGQTYYIYNSIGTCENETSFNITILPLTEVDQSLGDIEICDPYTVSASLGQIYTAPGGPNGIGTLVLPNQVFDWTQTFYLYGQSTNECPDVDRPFTRFYYGIDLPVYTDVFQCESDNYQLPPLTHLPNTIFDNRYSIGYFFSPNGVDPIPSDFVFNAEGVYTVYVFASNEGRFIACAEEKSFTINVGATPILPSYTIYEGQYCNSFTLPPLPSIPNATVNYYSAPGGQAADLISPSNYTINEAGIYTIWVYAFSNFNPECFSEISFEFEIITSPNMNIADKIICIDPVTNIPLSSAFLYSSIDSSIYTIEWYLDNNLVFTGPTYIAVAPGVYTVVAYVTDPSAHTQLYCDYNNYEVTVSISSKAIANVTVSPPFLNPNSAIVNVTGGFGNYTFSLDNGPFSSQNIFENLTTGFHQVTIRDVLNNCGDVILSFYIIDYPRYFTPNNDGYNDTWNINRYQSALGNTTINIFDRYGKLIHIIASENQGWNGKYNGLDLPSSDYWFTIDYFDFNNEKQTFKAHFSLKR